MIGEADRLAALRQLRILDTPPEEHFEAVCRTAERLFGVATAVVSLIDADRQWLKTACEALPQTLPRSVTFCDHTIRSDAVFVVPDASTDPHFASGELIVGGPGIRFYAGAPLILRPGIRLGALCLIDTRPRAFSEADAQALQDLAAIVVAHLRLHEANALREGEVEARRAHEAMIEAQASQLRQREAALTGANRLLTLAEEMSQIGHWRVSLGDGCPVWSEGAYRIMGIETGTDLPTLSEIVSLYHPDDREHVTEIVRSAARDGTGYDYEARVLRPDGVLRHVSVGGICEIDAAGRAVGLFGTIIDITARKEAAQALERSEARYRGLAEALPLLVWTTRMSDGQATFTNACFHEYCGTIGLGRLDRQDRNHPDDRPAMEAAWTAAVAAGTPLRMESRLRRHDGVYRWHKVVMIPIPQADGSAPAEWLGTALDIDDIITAQKRLEETSDLLRLAQSAADAAAWDWDMRSGAITLAPEHRRMYGLPEDGGPLQVSAAGWTELVHPDDSIPTWDAVRHAVESGTDYSAEYRIVGGGSERWMHACGRALYDAEGRPFRMVGLSFDVTQRKRAEAALQAAIRAAEAARVEAERASEAKSEFLAAMSHEIRTPLNGILGYADLILDGRRQDPEDRRRLELIQASGAALLTVVNDILDFSKIEAGQLELDPMAFPLHGLVDNTVSIVRGSALKSPLTIACQLDSELPPFVLGDASRLRQVLLNLLNNAVKFTPQGSVTLSVRHEGSRTLPSGETVEAMRFSVTDTGIGIAPGQLERLFKRFSQVDGSISRRFGGSGLGLAICRHLVTLMGGEIGVESREGVGSTFWFTLALPRRDGIPDLLPELPALPAAQALAPEAASASPETADAVPPRLLLVEDVRINQELAKAVLAIRGYRVDVVEDGADAVAAVREAAEGQAPYDLVLMDVQMPGMDGLTATRLIRALPSSARDVPIVAMTANVLPKQIADLEDAGMDDHVGKPFKRPQLYAVIDRWVGHEARKRRGEAGPGTQPSTPEAAETERAAAILDDAAFAAVRERMGPARIQSLLMLLEAELRARFAATDLRGLDALERQQLAHDAHAIVSAAGVLGFSGIAALCREVEAACHAGTDLAPLIRRLSALRGGTIETIRSLRAA